MTRLVRAEIRKLTTTRLWIGLTAGGIALVAFYAIVVGFTAGNRDAGRNAIPALSDPSSVRMVYGVPFEIGYLMPLVLGVTVICGEFRHRTITPTLLVTPRRSRVLTAKVITAAVAGLVMGLALTVAAAVVGAIVIAGRGYPVLLTSDGIPRMFGLMVLGLAVWCVFGLGFGALLRNQVAALISALVLVTVIEGLLGLLLEWIDLGVVAQYLPSRASAAIVEPANVRNLAMLPWWGGGLVLLLWGLVTAALGSLLTLRRDIT